MENKKTLFITGSNGFVGKNLIQHFKNNYKIISFDRNNFNIDADVFIHLAGIAHDLESKIQVQDYYNVNYGLTKKIFESFLKSNAKLFIYISTIKVYSENFNELITEDISPEPISHYGKSKLLSEEYLKKYFSLNNKFIIILRPSLIYGPGNKGNLSLLENLIKKKIPWPLGLFNNKRTFCSIYNFNFIINELINSEIRKSDIYNICDDDYISTNKLYEIIASSLNVNYKIYNIPIFIIKMFALLGDFFNFNFNTKNLNKLSSNLYISNYKIKKFIDKKLPYTTKQALIKTFYKE